jgi:hypothetical protein
MPQPSNSRVGKTANGGLSSRTVGAIIETATPPQKKRGLSLKTRFIVFK